MDLRLTADLALIEHLCSHDDDPFATNSTHQPRPGGSPARHRPPCKAPPSPSTYRPISWHCIRLTEGNPA